MLRPTAGQVEVDGISLAGASPGELDRYRRDVIATIGQIPGADLIPHLPCSANVALGLRLRGAENASARAMEMPEQVGLGNTADRLPDQLSGGERQRVSLAAALVSQPHLLLADEPTGSLDAQATQDVFDLLRSFNQLSGLTQIIVSHDPDVARHVDRVIAIRDGRVASE